MAETQQQQISATSNPVSTTAAGTSSGTSSGTSAGIEQWDLTSLVSPYLDRHMIFPLLEYLDSLISQGVITSYSSREVAEARLALLRPTHMVDYMIDVYKSIHDNGLGNVVDGAGAAADGAENNNNVPVPIEMEEQKQKVYKELEDLRKQCEPFDLLAKNDEQRAKLVASGQWNIEALSQLKDSGVTPEVLSAYRQLARYNFDCGDYQSARTQLATLISLETKPPVQPAGGPTTDDDDDLLAASGQQQQQQQQQQKADVGNPHMYYLQTVDANMLEMLWGRLACDILVEDWEASSVAVEAVKTAMESMVTSKQLTALQALHQRTWLLHWSLFVYWNDSAKGGLEQLVDLFHTERYKQAITTIAPHLLRYLTAAVLLCKRRVTKKVNGAAVASAITNAEARKLMKNLIYVMQDCEYSDPIVEFVNCLCVKFDFDSAQLKLAECEKVLAADFFLCHQTALFMEEARVFVFENYCRIHNKIDLKALGEKLAMDQDSAERWIVDLIRNADLDAKIDSDEGCVVMGSGTVQSIYEQVMDKTRDWNIRSATVAQNLNNLLNETRKERLKLLRDSTGDDY